METASADVSHVFWPNAFEVGEWGRFPRDRVHSVGIHKGKPSNEPQGMPMIELRHFPRTGRLRAWIETLLNLLYMSQHECLDDMR